MSRRIPHAVPLSGPTLSKEAAADLLTLLREPRLEARAEGAKAFYKGGTNPYELLTPEAVSWQAGYDYELEENS